MPSTLVLRRRIKSVKNTKQITKAMELVAAAKMRRVQDAVINGRAYAETANTMMRRIATQTNPSESIFFAVQPVKTRLYIVYTSDRGLAGAYNTRVLHSFVSSLEKDEKDGVKALAIMIGRKGSRFASKLQAVEVMGAYEQFEDLPSGTLLKPIIDSIQNGYTAGDFQAVRLIKQRFYSTLKQEVEVTDLLPVPLPSEEDSPHNPYDFEPGSEIVLTRAVELYLESQILQARIDAAASEHAMRMMAMSSANRNAGEIIDNLTLELNATRQAAITQEIAEISAGVEVMKD